MDVDEALSNKHEAEAEDSHILHREQYFSSLIAVMTDSCYHLSNTSYVPETLLSILPELPSLIHEAPYDTASVSCPFHW